MSAAAVVAGLLGAGVEVRAEGDRVRLREPRPGLLRPEHAPAVRACRLPLLAIASGRWRAELETWTAVPRDEWEERTAAYTFGAGISAELAERVAFLEVSALPDPPAVPPEAPCPECGVFGPEVASGLGSCEACGWVPRLAWPWSAPAARIS